MNNKLITKRSLIAGLIAFFSLLLFYFILLTLANSFSHAFEQFLEMWYWLLFLALGFGIQFGLYWLIRDSIKNTKILAAKSGLAASGGVSTVSMVACCAHHLIELAPIIGLSALWLFFADYQISFVLIGLFANLIGIGVMLSTIKKHNLTANFPFLQSLMKLNFLKIVFALVVIGLIAIGSSFYSSSQKVNNRQSESQAPTLFRSVDLQKIVKDEGGLTVEADPLAFQPNQKLTINLTFNTHEGDLNSDLLDKAILVDDRNRQYKPTSWDGGKGGHHLTGNLEFPKINLSAKQIKLVIKDIYEVPERSFEWIIE